MHISQRKLQIEWGDCDPAGIVFYPRYFAWFDASTANHFASVGLPKPELIARYGVVGFPMVDTQGRFYIPSKFGDEVTIETSITGFGKSSFDVHHRLLRGDKLAVEGFEKRVLVKRADDGEGIKSVQVPDEIRTLFQ
ncbi:4-hydroxybenzoyl-CoA thioesterase [Amylibacter ulvae]|uniref:4-hydroxybenzoyl-CoA thioesterase n=1 Tax=Paramylibacter ulvae TaxID=1651968 RepID=A0ABQ3D085_9RHOB|nr:acyl-CoA thioesterase [Amylibacter ulvae]GHA51610.1 4-hydroxybenzoyl-CoA thioesterase [Amylibacter ulvae]